MKDQIKNCPHLKDKIQKQLDQQKKMPAPSPKPAQTRAQVKVVKQAKKPEPEKKKEAKKDVKQEDFLGIYYAQMEILIKASEETKQKIEKLHQENRTINTNMVKLLRRVETLENKVESSNASIPEF
jgi:chromatin segregation and condensation protein Rec8/ScpA/Scc1 (kleisin family)